ncbi:MAG: ISNCY family transposase [Dongiaceae bacterium]
MKFEVYWERWQRWELSQVEAAEALGVTERTFRRWRQRYDEEGIDGLSDRRLGKPSPKRVPEAWADRVEQLYRERYVGFNARHFWEHLVKDHGFPFSYSWAKTFLHRRQLVAMAPAKGTHRKKRPRRPLPGMLVHQDGSRHAWLPGRDWQIDLITTMDDATNELYSAFLIEEEGTQSSFRGLRDVISRQGLFCALYTDRAGHYFYTPKAGEPVDKERLTQVGRALAQLGIDHIPAYSPEARGRSERLFGTLQDRLPKELRLAGIADIEAANRFIAELYLPAHNARFAVPAEQPGAAFVRDRDGAFADILCIQEERVVGNDNTVRYRGLSLQLPESRLRPHFVKAKVRVHDYLDGTIAVFHGPRRLATYDNQGRLADHAQSLAA